MLRDCIFLCIFVFVTVNTSIARFSVRSFDQEIPSSSILTSNCNGSSNENEFQQLIVKNGNVYVGATNTILQYSRNLELINQFDNGPRNDSSSCVSPRYCDLGDLCQDTLRCANNYNRLLLPYRNQLLACGSLHAVCDLLDLSNISRTVGSSRNLKCRNQDLARQLVSVGTRNLELSLVAAIRENLEYPNRDLIYLGRPDHFIEVLYAPSLQYSYFTVIDQFVENVYNKVAVYHLAWTTEDYGYVLWTNSTTEETKLSRYCNNIMSEFSRSRFREELNYPDNIGDRTYTEISLQCRGTNLQPLSTVIAAKFIYNELFILYQDGSDAVICASNVTYLNAQFDFVRDRCWNSDEGPRYARFLNSNVNCSNLGFFDAEWGSCGIPSSIAQFISVEPVLGLNPVNLFRRMTHGFSESEIATSFAINSHNGFYIVFIGTTNGSILKFRVGINSFLMIEKLVSKRRHPILNSMVIDNIDENLYTISSSSLYRVRVDNCRQQYTKCTACILDPYCGWCVQSGVCTRRTSCPSADQDESWIGPLQQANRCPRVSSITPDIISVEIPQVMISLTFAGIALPRTLNYSCEFSVEETGARFAVTKLENLTADSRSGSCNFPTASSSLIPITDDHANVTVMIVGDGVLASGHLKVYQCSKVSELNKFSMCSSCVTSEWGCSWCVSTGTCGIAPICSNQLVITQQECPIVTGSNVNSSAFIAANREMDFFLQTRFLPENAKNFTCQFDFCGKTSSTRAITHPSSGLVQCVNANLRCDEEFALVRVSLKITQLNNYTIDISSLESVTGNLYNCGASSIRSSCLSCMGFRRKYIQCAWCFNGSSCMDISQCPRGSTTSGEDCEAPAIDSISPTNGPLQGETYVTITGRNFGYSLQDIRRVRVGRIDCNVHHHSSRSIECLSGAARNNADSGPVTLITSYQKQARSSTSFQYLNAIAWEFAPRVVLNKTSVQISGRMLNIGNSATLFFAHDNNTFTTCTNRQERTIVCQLPPVKKVGRYSVVLKIDGYVSNFTFREIEIVNNPQITNYDGTFFVFRSAGRNITAKLTSLLGVVQVQFQINIGIMSHTTNCAVHFDELLVECFVSPMADIVSVHNLAQENSFPVELILNRVYHIFLGKVKFTNDPIVDTRTNFLPCVINNPSASAETESVEIRGQNFILDDGMRNSDYNISFIPEKTGQIIPCIVSLITPNILRCDVKISQWNMYKDEKYIVTVTIEKLVIEENLQCNFSNLPIVVMAIVIPAVVVLIAVLACYFCGKNKKLF